MAKEGERCEMMSDSSVSNAPFSFVERGNLKFCLIYLNKLLKNREERGILNLENIL